MGRRPPGTGSVHQRKSDGMWIGTIEAGWTARGTRRRITVSARNERVCRQRLKDKERELAKSGTPAEAATVRGTVKSAAEDWLESTSRTLRPTTWQSNASQVKNWIIPTIGHRRLTNLSPADVRAVQTAIIDAGRAASTATRAHAILQTILKHAALEGSQVPTAAFMVKPPPAGEPDRDAIPLPDALEILAVASQRPDASRWVAALLQGMRPAECYGLTWDAIDFEAQVLDVSWQLKALPYRVKYDRSSGFRVPIGYTAKQVKGAIHLVRPKSTAGQRIIPMVEWMSNELLAWRSRSPRLRHNLVWTMPDGEPMDDDYDRQAWRDLCDQAQVAHLEGTHGRRYGLYEARHTTATLLKQAGVDDETIEAIMGHASILSTKAYLHTSATRTRQALTTVATRLGLQIEQGGGPSRDRSATND